MLKSTLSSSGLFFKTEEGKYFFKEKEALDYIIKVTEKVLTKKLERKIKESKNSSTAKASDSISKSSINNNFNKSTIGFKTEISKSPLNNYKSMTTNNSSISSNKNNKSSIKQFHSNNNYLINNYQKDYSCPSSDVNLIDNVKKKMKRLKKNNKNAATNKTSSEIYPMECDYSLYGIFKESGSAYTNNSSAKQSQLNNYKCNKNNNHHKGCDSLNANSIPTNNNINGVSNAKKKGYII